MQDIHMAAWLFAVLVQSTSSPATMTWIPSTFGPYVARILKVYECSRDGTWEPKVSMSLRTSRYSPFRPRERQRVSGNVSLSFNITDADWAHVMVEKRANNEWKRNFFIMPMPRSVCSLARKYFPMTFKAFFGEVNGACIMKEGNYNVVNREIDMTMQSFPIVRYGVYRGQVRVGKAGTDKTYLCSHCEVDILQKPSG